MKLDNLKTNVASLGNSDIDFFLQQVENLNNKTDIEIVFSGTVSNGKSTLINALLGMDLLPMELGSTTSLITTLQKGEDNIVAKMNDGSAQDYSLEKASIKVISEDNTVESITIYMELFPYNGIKFVDTPGINDIQQERAEKTFNYVPLADAVIFVVDSSKGLTAEEQLFFENKVVKANKDKIFIVLNKIDTISEEEIDTTKLLSSAIANEYSIYQMSALKYLAGVLKNDKERIENSGAEKFKNDLNEYLLNLDKNKIFKTRIEKSLKNILKLANIQIDTLVNNTSQNKPDIEFSINDVNIKISDAKIKQTELEKEIDVAISEIKECIHQNLSKLKMDISSTIHDVKNKEFMIDQFNEKVPLLCFAMIENIQKCSDSKLKGLDVDFEELNELYLYVIRNIDDVMAGLVWLLTFIPTVGKVITPFVPKIQEGVRQLVDMFGGKLIQGSVESKVDELMTSIEENLSQSISEYKNNLLSDYEHNQLGAIRSELISLKSLLKMNEDKKESIEHQVQYYQKSRDALSENIEKLLVENNN
jgi:small GTP-binding protein